jgi:hypothetical protein
MGDMNVCCKENLMGDSYLMTLITKVGVQKILMARSTARIVTVTDRRGQFGGGGGYRKIQRPHTLSFQLRKHL